MAFEKKKSSTHFGSYFCITYYYQKMRFPLKIFLVLFICMYLYMMYIFTFICTLVSCSSDFMLYIYIFQGISGITL